MYILLKHTQNFSRMDHILGHKRSPSKFKEIKIISSIFSDHDSIKQKSITGGKLDNSQIPEN